MSLESFKEELKDQVRHNRMQASILRHSLSDNIRFLEDRLGKLRRALDSDDDVLTLADHGQLPYAGVVQDLGQKIDLDACRLAYFIGDAKLAKTQLELVKQVETKLSASPVHRCHLPREAHSVHLTPTDPPWKPSGHEFQPQSGDVDGIHVCGYEVPPPEDRVEYLDSAPVSHPLNHKFRATWKKPEACATVHMAGGIRVQCRQPKSSHSED